MPVLFCTAYSDLIHNFINTITDKKLTAESAEKDYENEDLKTLEQHLMDFQVHYEKIAKPFNWKFTKKDLRKVLLKISSDNLDSEKLAA